MFVCVCVLSHAAVQVDQNWEVVYRDTDVYGVVGKAVILECGPTLPDMYIWSFTKPGTEAIKAVVYDLGKGTRIQKLAEGLGQLSVISNSAAVSIEKLPLAAHGLFTCQAFYDIEQEPKVYYYYVHLTVRGKRPPLSHRLNRRAAMLPWRWCCFHHHHIVCEQISWQRVNLMGNWESW